MKTETDSLEMPSEERETERFLKDSLETERESESHLVGGDADGGRFPTCLGVALP